MKFSANPDKITQPPQRRIASDSRNSHHTNWSQTVLIIVLIMQTAAIAALGWLVYNMQLPLGVQLVNEVSRIVAVDPYSIPSIAVISDVNALKAGGPIYAETYKNAQNGDYLLGMGDRLVIYRRSSAQVIYDNKAPGVLLAEQQKKLVADATTAANEAGLLKANSQETPLATLVDNPDVLKKQNASFYENLTKDDIVAEYKENGVVIIYRPSTKQIVNSASVSID